MSTTTATHTDQLGSRPIGPLLWHACSQTTLSVGVYGIYALTNAWFVARGVGATAMAAVNLVAPLLLALGAVSTALGVGAASVISRSLGAGDPAGAGRAAGTTFTVFWAAAITTTVVGLVALDPLLRMLGAHGPTLDYARDYAVIILAGAIMSTGFSSLVRAEGRMRFSTMLWIIPVLVQITLDPLFIFVLDLGVRGAALGTVGGQAVSAAMSLWFFFLQRHRPYRVGLHDLRPRATVAGPLLGIGAPSFLAGFGATLLAVAVNTSLSASGGATALAAFAICARIQTFVVMPQLGISQGMQPIVGYNAGRLRRRTRRAGDRRRCAALDRHRLRRRGGDPARLRLLPGPRPTAAVVPAVPRHPPRHQAAPRARPRARDGHHRYLDRDRRRRSHLRDRCHAGLASSVRPRAGRNLQVTETDR